MSSPTRAQVRRAALLTAAKPGYRADVNASVTLSTFDNNPVTATGDGYFDHRTGSGALKLRVTLPGLLGATGAVPVKVIAVGEAVYFEVPRALRSGDPRSPRWLSASLPELGLSTLDPGVILAQVARDATTHVDAQRAHVTITRHTGLINTIHLSYRDQRQHARVSITLRLTSFDVEPSSAPPPASQSQTLSAGLGSLGF